MNEDQRRHVHGESQPDEQDETDVRQPGTDGTPGGNQAMSNDSPSEAGGPDSEEALVTDELEIERARSAEFLEQAQRSRAELINYRRRVDQEMEQIRKHAGERIITRLLPVLDDFHRAIEAVPETERDNAWLQGMLLIERKLWSIMEAEGVRPIEALGKPFDPSLHEAVTVDESAGSGGTETVVEEFQRGYTMHDRVIRPAMVKVGRRMDAD